MPYDTQAPTDTASVSVLPTITKVVTDTSRNPFADLSLDGRGREARYRYIK